MTPVDPAWPDVLVVGIFAVLAPLWAWLGAPAMRRFLDEAGSEARRHVYRESIGLLSAMAGVCVLLWILQDRPLRQLGLAAPNSPFLLGGLACTGLVIAILGGRLRRLQRSDAAREAVRREIDTLRVSALMPRTRDEHRLFGNVAIAAGVAEEVLYRGYLPAVLGASFGMGAGLVISIGAFGFAHAYQGPRGMGRALIAGAIATLLTWTTQSLWPAILLHIAVDLYAGTAARLALVEDPRDLGHARP